MSEGDSIVDHWNRLSAPVRWVATIVWLAVGAVLYATAAPEHISWDIPDDEHLEHAHGRLSANGVRTELQLYPANGRRVSFVCSMEGKHRGCLLPGVTGHGSRDRSGSISYFRVKDFAALGHVNVLIMAKSDDGELEVNNRHDLERWKAYVTTHNDYLPIVYWSTFTLLFAVSIPLRAVYLGSKAKPGLDT